MALGIGIGSGYLFETTFKREKSLLYEGLMHYFVIRFPQRPVALLSFIRDVLGPNDDIVYFSYTRRYTKRKGPQLSALS